MKYFYIIFALLIFTSCSSIKKVGYSGEKYKISKELNKFLLDFENAGRNQKKTLMLNLMDRAYKKEQHDEMLEGRTDQFLNEFFAGTLVGNKDFKSVPFKTIKTLKFVSINQTGENSFNVFYIVEGVDFKINCQWEIIKKTFKGKTVFGLVGASG